MLQFQAKFLFTKGAVGLFCVGRALHQTRYANDGLHTHTHHNTDLKLENTHHFTRYDKHTLKFITVLHTNCNMISLTHTCWSNITTQHMRTARTHTLTHIDAQRHRCINTQTHKHTNTHTHTHTHSNMRTCAQVTARMGRASCCPNSAPQPARCTCTHTHAQLA
jgi:hypothetical protein